MSEKEICSEDVCSSSCMTDFIFSNDDVSSTKCMVNAQDAMATFIVQDELSSIKFSLIVETTAENGSVRTSKIPLTNIEGVDDLRGLFYQLLTGAFPMHNHAALPEYLVSEQYCKFTLAEDFVSLSEDVVHTHFKLVAHADEWEFTIAERAFGSAPDPEKRFVVTVAEFESVPVDLPDGRALVVSLVTFPTVSIHRDCLREALQNLDDETGIFSRGPSDRVGEMQCTIYG